MFFFFLLEAAPPLVEPATPILPPGFSPWAQCLDLLEDASWVGLVPVSGFNKPVCTQPRSPGEGSGKEGQ